MSSSGTSHIDPVTMMLRRRGFRVLLANPTQYLIFPPEYDSTFEEELYELLKKYSFRIFIRDVIKKRRSLGVEDLLKYSTREWVEKYLEFLLKKGVVERMEGERFRLMAESVFSFGDTLEWFVARIFEKEFGSPSLWGVRLEGAEAGGDYDVVADMEGRLVYVEVKSSPPKNVEEVEVVSFIKRVEALVPSMAVFLEDTKLRMKDKIVPFFESVADKKGLRVERLRDEIFSIKDKVYITNSSPDIIGNLAFCIQHHLTAGGFWQRV